MELELNSSIAKFDLLINELTSSGIVSLTADIVLSSAKLQYGESQAYTL